MNKITIFVSSSLSDSAQPFRDMIDQVVTRFNEHSTNISFETCRCENDCISGFLDGPTHDNANLANEKAMLDSDLVLIILGDYVGEATEKEYLKARKHMKRCFLVRVHGVGSNNRSAKTIDTFIRDNNLPPELNDNTHDAKDADAFLCDHNVYAHEIMPCDNPVEQFGEALTIFLRKHLATFLAPTYNPTTFCYADVLKANGQQYREAVNTYAERDVIDRDIVPGERVITFTGMSMAGKTHAAVRLIQRLTSYAQSKPTIIVITPCTPERTIDFATSLLSDGASEDDLIVLIDDVDSPLFQFKAQSMTALIGAMAQHIARDSTNSLLILTAKERISSLYGIENLPERRLRHIKPLTDSEWRYYRANLIVKGYVNDAVDIKNQHVIGAITSQRRLESLKTVFSTWMGDGESNALVAYSVRIMAFYMLDNRFHIDDAAYLYLYLQWDKRRKARNTQTKEPDIDEARWLDARQEYVEKLRELLDNGMLISIDEEGDGLVTYDEYITEHLFKLTEELDTLKDSVQDPHILLLLSTRWRFIASGHYQPAGIKGFSAVCKYFTRIIQSISFRNNSETFNKKIKDDILSSLSTLLFKPEHRSGSFNLDTFLKCMADDEKEHSYNDEELNTARYWALALLGVRIGNMSGEKEAWRSRCEIAEKLQTEEYRSRFNKLQAIDRQILMRPDLSKEVLTKILEANFEYRNNECTFRKKDEVGELDPTFIAALVPLLSFREACALLETLVKDLSSARETSKSNSAMDWALQDEADMGFNIDMDNIRTARTIAIIAPKVFEKITTKEDFNWLFGYLRDNFSRIYEHKDSEEIKDADVLSKIKPYFCERAFRQMEEADLKTIADKILSIKADPSQADPSGYAALLTRKMLLNVLMRVMPFYPAVEIFEKMGQDADNFTLSAIIGHEDASFEMAMGFVANVVQNSLKDENPLRPSLIVYNILLGKAATGSDLENVRVLMEKTGHQPDSYSLGAICRQKFLSYGQRVDWLKKYMPGPEAKPRPISILSPLLEMAPLDYEARRKVLFCENPEEEYGITKAEQSEMRQSPRLLSLLFKYAPDTQEVFNILRDYGIDWKEMLGHPDGNIMTEMLKNRSLFPTLARQREFVESLGIKPTIFMKMAMLAILEEEIKREGANGEDIIKEANVLTREIMTDIRDNDDLDKDTKASCLSRMVMRRARVFKDADARQSYVLDADSRELELTPTEYVKSSLDKIKADTLFTFFKAIGFDKDKVLDVLNGARRCNMRFSVELLSKLSNSLNIGWDYDKADTALKGLCHYKDLLKNLLVSLTLHGRNPKTGFSWERAESLIEEYNQSHPNSQLHRTVAYFNALLQSIPAAASPKDLDKATEVVEKLHNAGSATIQTYLNYIKVLKTAEDAVAAINSFGIFSKAYCDIMRFVGIVAYKAKSPDEFESLVLPWVNGGVLNSLNQYVVNCLSAKVFTKKTCKEYYALWEDLSDHGCFTSLPGISDKRLLRMIKDVQADIFTYTKFVGHLDRSVNIPETLIRREIPINANFIMAAFKDTVAYEGKTERYIYLWKPSIEVLLSNLPLEQIKEIARDITRDSQLANYLISLQPKFKPSYFKAPKASFR